MFDTPGLLDTGFSREDFAAELGRSIYECSPGPISVVFKQICALLGYRLQTLMCAYTMVFKTKTPVASMGA